MIIIYKSKGFVGYVSGILSRTHLFLSSVFGSKTLIGASFELSVLTTRNLRDHTVYSLCVRTDFFTSKEKFFRFSTDST